MRKDSKTLKSATVTTIDSYHGGVWDESYAYRGFKTNRYFTSDRFITLDAQFRRPDGKPLKGFGLEIETECTGIRNGSVLAEVLNKIIFPNFPADLFKLQRDGSLGGDTSAECITQVMTREFIRNNYSAFKLMYDTYFPAFRISCGSNCGMHVNISTAVFGSVEKTQAEAIRKLYYIVNHHYALCCALFNRDRLQTNYCMAMRSDFDYCRTLDLANTAGGHGVSFNLAHYLQGRIELRIVGGRKNYPCFRNTMESVFFLCDAVKRLSWDDVQDPVRIFSGCNQYVFDRLRSYCREAGTISDDQLTRIRPTVNRAEYI